MREFTAPLGIICAMPEERAALLDSLVDIGHREIAGREVLTGWMDERPVALVECGVGKVAAAMLATLLIRDFDCRALLVSGVAGGVDPALAIGDIVVARRLIQHDFGRLQSTGFTPFRPGTPPLGPERRDYAFTLSDDLAARIEVALADVKLADLPPDLGQRNGVGRNRRIVMGTIVSGDQFINDETVRQRLQNDFQADAVEMEGAAVAQVAAFFGVDLVVVRSLSDLAGADSHLDFGSFVAVVAPDAARVIRRLAAVI